MTLWGPFSFKATQYRFWTSTHLLPGNLLCNCVVFHFSVLVWPQAQNSRSSLVFPLVVDLILYNTDPCSFMQLYIYRWLRLIKYSQKPWLCQIIRIGELFFIALTEIFFFFPFLKNYHCEYIPEIIWVIPCLPVLLFHTVICYISVLLWHYFLLILFTFGAGFYFF